MSTPSSLRAGMSALPVMAGGLGRVIAGLGGAVTSMGTRLALEMRMRRDARHLSRLPDRMLADLGIGRGEIHALVRGEAGRDRRPRGG
jgi:uncharacterized protein YjiS (DUF1127 family)